MKVMIASHLPSAGLSEREKKLLWQTGKLKRVAGIYYKPCPHCERCEHEKTIQHESATADKKRSKK